MIDYYQLSKSNKAVIEAYMRGYRVSEDGSIIGLKGSTINGKISSKNYKWITIRIGSKSFVVFIHRLQAYQKFGEKIFEPGILVRHLNNDPLDNSWDNIDIGTDKDNFHDRDPEDVSKVMKEVGLQRRKYNYEEIKRLRSEGMSYSQLAELCETSKSQIYYICNEIDYGKIRRNRKK